MSPGRPKASSDHRSNFINQRLTGENLFCSLHGRYYQLLSVQCCLLFFGIYIKRNVKSLLAAITLYPRHPHSVLAQDINRFSWNQNHTQAHTYGKMKREMKNRSQTSHSLYTDFIFKWIWRCHLLVHIMGTTTSKHRRTQTHTQTHTREWCNLSKADGHGTSQNLKSFPRHLWSHLQSERSA